MSSARKDRGRVELRLRPEDKATLTRAASIKRLDLTGYILRTRAAAGAGGSCRSGAAHGARTQFLARSRPSRRPAPGSQPSGARCNGRLYPAVTAVDWEARNRISHQTFAPRIPKKIKHVQTVQKSL